MHLAGQLAGVGGCLHGLADVGQGAGHALQLGGLEATQDRLQQIAAQHVRVVEHLPAVIGEGDEHQSTVVRDADPLDEATLGHAVDETGGVRKTDVEHLRQAAHGQLAVSLEHPHHVEVAHAHAGAHQLLAADAAKLADRGADVGDDVAHDDLVVDRPGSGDSSHDTKDYSRMNYPVNLYYRVRAKEAACASR